MDPATLIGIAVAFGAILLTMILEGSSPMAIILIPPLILVFGGTFGAAVAGSSMSDVKKIGDSFLKRGLQMSIDGTDPEDLRAILEAEISAKKAEDKAAAKFFTGMGGYAPTIGIIGTVIGLIHVMENLSDPESIGPLIASAFVATLWGVLSANVFWLPMGAKIGRTSDLQAAQMELLVEGITEIQAGTSPRTVRAKLSSLVPPSEQQEAA